MLVRLVKSGLVFAVGFLFALIAFNNVNAATENFKMVQDVLGMSAVSGHHGRAISSALGQHLAFLSLLITETSVAGCCLIGSLAMFRCRSGSRAQFVRSQRFAVAGLGLGLFLFIAGFSALGWEWFLMWQIQDSWVVGFSNVMNRLVLICGVVLIFICLPEPD